MCNFMRAAAAAFVLCLALFSAVSAQVNPFPSQTGGRNSDGTRSDTERERRARDLRDREMMLRLVEREGRRRPSEDQPRLALVQIKNDFMQMQTLNRDLAMAVTSNVPLDFKFVSKSTSEIKKRASRLKANMMLPEIEKGPKPEKTDLEPSSDQVKRSLLALDHKIYGFVSNPIFQQANVVDAKLSDKARRDLEEIIVLSERIKKCSEKINKEAAHLSTKN